MSGKNILITGVTGFVGRFFTKALLTENPDINVYAPVRSKKGMEYYKREELAPLLCDRFHAVEGGHAEECIVKDRSSLPRIDEFWHIAGITDFQEEKRQQVMLTNVTGAQNAVSLVSSLNVKKFFHVSTAYVSGIHDGIVQEDGLLPNPKFRNVYEESKYLAEKHVRGSGLPWIIVRPSIVVGHSVSGEFIGEKTLYGCANLYYMLYKFLEKDYAKNGGVPKDLAYYIHADAEVTKNFVYIDSLVKMMTLIRRHAVPYQTFHCCNKSFVTVGDAHNIIKEAMGMEYIFLQDRLAADESKLQKYLNRGSKVYEGYLVYPDPVFSMDNIEAIQNGNIRQVDYEGLAFLINKYVRKLKMEKYNPAETTIDVSLLPVVKEYGDFSLAYESMSKQFNKYRAEGVDGFIAYSIIGNITIMVGNPVSSEPQKLTAAFIGFCRENSYECMAIQVDYKIASVFRIHGFSVNKIGIETFIDLKNFNTELVGKDYHYIRGNKNIATRYGLNVHESCVTEVNADEIKAISTAWMAQKKNTYELRLLLREISLSPEPYVRYFFVERDSKIVGYTFFDPIFKHGQVIGYFENIVRYVRAANMSFRNSSSNSIILAEAAKKFKQEGVRFISLGLSPLHDLDNSPYNDNRELKGFLEDVYDKSELYAFKGIAEHKQQYPATITLDMFFAYPQSSSAESVFNIFKAVGIFGD